MSLEQYNTNANPFLALSGMIKNKDAGGRASLGHALILQQVHHAGVMEALGAEHQYREQEAKTAHRRDLAKTRITHAQGMELEAQTAQHAAEHAERQHNLSIAAATHKAGLEESAAAATHARNKELLTGIKSAAQPGTQVELGIGDVRASFTKKTAPSRVQAAAPQAAPAAAEAPKKDLPAAGSGGWMAPRKKQIKASKGLKIVSSAPTPAPAAPAKSGPAVARDPKTGRAVSLKKK